MKKLELLRELVEIKQRFRRDPEVAHSVADKALLKYINDVAVTDIYNSIEKWYS